MKNPLTFTAAVLTRLGAPLEIISGIKVPALNRGQVLVKVAYSGVCHSQLMEARGFRGDDPWLPHLLGHEGTGTVVDVGNGVSKVAPGDKVVLGWIKGEGIEAGGCKYEGPNGEMINAGGVTTFSTYTIASENRLVKLPDATPMDLGVLYGCALPTGAGMILNTVRPSSSDTIAIVGLGGIGLSALMAASGLGVQDIFVIDIEPHKLELASQLGAKITINPSEQDPVSVIQEMTSGRGVDYSIEAAGTSKTIELAFDLLRRGGKCLFASHPKHGDRICLDPFEMIAGKKIEGSWGGNVFPDRDIPILGGLYSNGSLPLEKIISSPYSLDDINQALEDLEARKVTRALIKIDREAV